MLPSSVRRVAVSSPQSPLLAAAATSVTRSAYRPNQSRRYSSSKPSRDNGSKIPPVRQQAVPAAGEGKSKPSQASVSAPGEKRKRKAKDAAEKLNYPSVPTTAHIPRDFFALSSFFSLHRPISVVRGVPRIVSDDVFAAIFNPQTRSQRTADVMSTIARTVDQLEQPMATISIQQNGAEEGGIEESHSRSHPRLALLNADGPDAGLSVAAQVNNMMGQYLPFRPPPPPQAEVAESAAVENEQNSSKEVAAAEEAEADLQEDPQTRVYKAMFTIEETTDASGGVKIVAHSPELVHSEDDAGEQNHESWLRAALLDGTAVDEGAQEAEHVSRTPFLHRMALRQLRYEDARGPRGMMWAISVKRQRKLKMKKKKYKKLQKRLRHDRLKHGRT